VSSFRIASRTYTSFSPLGKKLAAVMDSITSTNRQSIRSPSEYRLVEGRVGRYSDHSTYARFARSSTGNNCRGDTLRGVSRTILHHTYNNIISVENLLDAWHEFVKGKKDRTDVQEFGRNLMSNVFALHHDLAAGTYQYGGYEHFKINDPKPRDIHKASVRDRLLHHALYRELYPFFDRTFIADSYSCRDGKGTHKAMNRFQSFARKVSRNDTRTCLVLKCDIRKFFASIDHETLLDILRSYVLDARIIDLLSRVIGSFSSTESGKGLPLGNLTSQLLVNIYMNEFDQWVKHKLKVRYYIRYADDFVFFSHDRHELEALLLRVREFLQTRLKLELHPDKVFIKALASGVDFLGWVHFSDHRVLRTSTKRRMLRALSGSPSEETVAAYRGMLGHGNAWGLGSQLPVRGR
jgi:RNA-directed DNA polymerase